MFSFRRIVGIVVFTVLVLAGFDLVLADSFDDLFYIEENTQESVCARVSLQVEQDMTLERQAFDAFLRINNGYAATEIHNVSVDVSITTTNGDPVAITSDPDDTNALFFIRVSDMEGITDITGEGTVQPKSKADIHWLIIPAPGAAGTNCAGQRYHIGGGFQYVLAGEENKVDLLPDTIQVRPMPTLEVDYFIPKDVPGDIPLTPEVEKGAPFAVGIRVANAGLCGKANGLYLESLEPKIVNNEQDMLISFSTLSSSLNGVDIDDSLLQFDFGVMEPLDIGVGLIWMECSFAGEFIELNADYTHADSLGGRVTTLISDMDTHIMIHPVMADLPGRDTVCDFLTEEEGKTWLYDSQFIDPQEVTNLSLEVEFDPIDTNGNEIVYALSCPPSLIPFYVNFLYPAGETQEIVSVKRVNDGSYVTSNNVWFSRIRRVGNDTWKSCFNLFDMFGSGAYEVTIANDEAQINSPPVIQMIADREVTVSNTVDFIVTAYDADKDQPSVTNQPGPVGAYCVDVSTNDSPGVETCRFSWTPEETGVTEVTFEATDAVDPECTTVRSMSITVVDAGSENRPDWWSSEHVLNTNAAMDSDYVIVNAGQLKHISAMAYKQMTNLPGGAGFELSFTNQNQNNYAVVTIGQLLAVATGFYDRLSRPYPWADNPNIADAYYSWANAGQVKNLFNFDPVLDSDGDRMPDWWEQLYTNSPGFMDPNDPSDSSEDPDMDMVPNLQEYLGATDPTNHLSYPE